MADPLPSHEPYRGFLAIPYWRWSHEHGWFVVSIRYRRIDGGSPKYLTQTGDRPWLYNTISLLKTSPIIAITEGEIDALTTELCGVPAVGVPGTQMWQPYFRELFLGYRDVYVLADGDEPGLLFANTVAKTLPNVKVIPMPTEHDVNSLVMTQGKEALLDRIGNDRDRNR